MFKLNSVERARERLALLMKANSAGENLELLSPQADAVTVASTALCKSTKLRKLLEVVLAFGNRMNSGRRGGAWGFKLSVFDKLTDLKSTDKQKTLMEFVVETIAD